MPHQSQPNPFDRSIKWSPLFLLAYQLIVKEKSTIFLFNVNEGFQHRAIANLVNVADRIQIISSEYFILTGFGGYQFITCHTQPSISFVFYVKPFQSLLWLMVGLCLPILIAVMTVYIKITFIRLILGTWSLFLIFLTNAYDGLMITDLNAPLRGSHPIYWKYLVCDTNDRLNLLSASQSDQLSMQSWVNRMTGSQRGASYWKNSVADRINEFIKPGDQNVSQDCFRLLSHVKKEKPGIRNYDFLIYLGTETHYLYDINNPRYLAIFKKHQSIKGATYLSLLLDFANPKHAYHAEVMNNYVKINKTQVTPEIADAAVEQEAAGCEKTVLITKSRMISAQLGHPSKWYPSKEWAF